MKISQKSINRMLKIHTLLQITRKEMNKREADVLANKITHSLNVVSNIITSMEKRNANHKRTN